MISCSHLLTSSEVIDETARVHQVVHRDRGCVAVCDVGAGAYAAGNWISESRIAGH